MAKKVLITGGAGFIGSHFVDFLIEKTNNEVFVYDNLDGQVHDNRTNPPDYLNKKVSFIKASVLDYEVLKESVESSENIIHLAAKVGVGQSMYQINDYVGNNILGMANLLDILVNSEHNVKKVIIASSNTIYGEGKALCSKCGIIFPKLRLKSQLEKKEWEIYCPECNDKAKPVLTDEKTPYDPSSIYALSKQIQEEMSLMIGNTYGIDVCILRFFLVYGPRQSLSNPYTGVCAIFSTRLLNGNHPIVFEDGLQSRDFINVGDVCQALSLALTSQSANGEVFNVGTGIPTTIQEVAEIITEKINPKLKPVYNQQFRIGDIRHCVADITKIKKKLGYEPKITFNEGIEDFINWLKLQKSRDTTDMALSELKEKGLLK
ncbi:MAG: GDP-mannose 4,6-dehydratase [Candidatus Thorarchaeota archaeon]